MNGLIDISGLRTAPMLEALAVWGAPLLRPRQFRLLASHPTLKRASVDLRTKAKNDEVRKLLPLPPAYYSKDDGFKFK